MTEQIDTLDLAEGQRISIVREAHGLAALPAVRDDQVWRRSHAGDGTAEALIALLAAVDGCEQRGRFTIRTWTARGALGERPVGVDQTNESVIVGAVAVVKWSVHLTEGPHPAPRRISVLRDAGFAGMPQPWGLVTWRLPDGGQTVAASVDAYVPDAVDGWTWAVDDFTDAVVRADAARLLDVVTAVGTVVAEMHAALATTATVASDDAATRWLVGALETLDTACRHSELATDRRAEIEQLLVPLGELAGTPIIEGHGDLHVGQILRSRGSYVITDFDGNPVLTPQERALPVPAALDVAGMTQSLTHAGIVARKYTALDAGVSARTDALSRAAFLDAYRARLATLGHPDLFDPAPLRALRLQQVLREIIYAAKFLPRWMYVPDAALPALLAEGH